MAAGSRRVYALDLNDTFVFPDADNIPLEAEEGDSWVMLLQVSLLSSTMYFRGNTHGFTFCEKIMRFPPSRVKYATVDITGKLFEVVINTSNPSLDTVDYKRGDTMCILNAKPLLGANEQLYFRVDDISTVEVRFSTCFLSN